LIESNIVKYGEDVLSGKVDVCLYVRMSVARHFEELKRGDVYTVKKKDEADIEVEWEYYFDPEAGMRIVNFFGILILHEGEFAGRPFHLQPWQAWSLYVAFGWKRKDNQKRRFKYMYIEVPRKNGKSCLMGGVALYHLTKDDENAPWIYFVATTFSQAMEPMNDAIGIAENTPSLLKRLDIRKRSILYPANNGNMIAVASDSKKKDGLNPSLVVLDEFHAHADDGMFTKMKTAFGMRQQPTMLIITTAGSDKAGPCYDYRNRGIEVLQGTKIQDNLFSIIYTIDEEDDWKSSDNWVKANPSWGIMNEIEFNQEAGEAIEFASAETSFKNLRLNMWTDAPSVWIQDATWMECDMGKVPDMGMRPCYAGADFAESRDLCALVLQWPGEPRQVKSWFWIPEKKVREKEDRVDYWVWKKNGFINVIDGNAINHEDLAEEVLDILKQYNVVGMTYDAWGIGEATIQSMINRGYPTDRLHPMKQRTPQFQGPIRAMEEEIENGKVNHEGNPVLRWNVANVVLYRDTHGGVKFDKKRNIEKIDGAVAMAMSYAEELDGPKMDQGNLYTL